MSKIFSVNEINSYISNLIEYDDNLVNIKIQGEISNLVNHSTGHCYLTLKDNFSYLQAIIFKSKLKIINLDLKVGQKIIAIGTIKGYSKGGTYSFWINSVKLDGIGEIYLNFEKLKSFYQKKGYFDQSIKKSIPIFPKNIGVVTALTGAAIRDIITTIDRRYKISNIFLFPCIVQGKYAAIDISNKIQEANNFSRKLDVIIVGRGGGSFEDLSCFSDKEVIESIYNSNIPIVSAVGHEIDYQISDWVADRRAATPTAAGEIVTPDTNEIIKFIKENQNQMLKNIVKKINVYKKELNLYKNNYHLNNLDWIYREKYEKLNLWKEKIVKNIETIIENKIDKLLKNKMKLQLLCPMNVLSRGYSIIKNKSNKEKIVTSKKMVKENDNLSLITFDGEFNAKVI